MAAMRLGQQGNNPFAPAGQQCVCASNAFAQQGDDDTACISDYISDYLSRRISCLRYGAKSADLLRRVATWSGGWLGSWALLQVRSPPNNPNCGRRATCSRVSSLVG